MTTFKQLQENTDIRELIKSTFDVDLALTGGWGYTKETATVITSLPEGMSLPQLEHMLATIRAQLEMNITQKKENRYGAINANEKAREESSSDEGVFNKITYVLTGIKEERFNAFIKEYKEGYGKEDFDLNAHFKRRQEATLTRQVVHYFKVNALQ